MLVMVNVDNVAGETVPHIIEKLMELGAASVHAVPAITKKGRPEFIFLIDTARENVEAVGDFLAREVGTLGLRLFEEVEHIKYNYEMRKVKLSLRDDVTDERALNLVVGVKVIRGKDGSVVSAKAEYEELKAAANALAKVGMNVSLIALKEMIEASALKGEGRVYQNLSVELAS